jgi:hypothetical protein
VFPHGKCVYFIAEDYLDKMMLCIKVIQGNIPMWGIQGRLERLLCDNFLPSVLLASARGIVGWRTNGRG